MHVSESRKAQQCIPAESHFVQFFCNMTVLYVMFCTTIYLLLLAASKERKEGFAAFVLMVISSSVIAFLPPNFMR